MKDHKKSDLENDARELASVFRGILSWKWDSCFDPVRAEFGTEDKDRIRSILERHFEYIEYRSRILWKIDSNVP